MLGAAIFLVGIFEDAQYYQALYSGSLTGISFPLFALAYGLPKLLMFEGAYLALVLGLVNKVCTSSFWHSVFFVAGRGEYCGWCGAMLDTESPSLSEDKWQGD